MFHTLGELKNRVAQSPDEMEPPLRIACEGEIMRVADRLIAATALERDQMAALYGADPREGLDRPARRGSGQVPAAAV